jgi:putative membrane protein
VQNERTSLSWVRTGLGLAGCALLAGRLAMLRQSPWAVGAAAAAGLLAFGVLGWSHDRYRRAARAIREDRPVDRAVAALLVTLAVCLVGVFALVLVVF